jgi:hypothetical protein
MRPFWMTNRLKLQAAEESIRGYGDLSAVTP